MSMHPCMLVLSFTTFALSLLANSTGHFSPKYFFISEKCCIFATKKQ